MALHCSKAILLHAALANISHELVTLDDVIRAPVRNLPTELLLIIRTYLSTILTTQLYVESTHALIEYETNLQRLLCSDCISYNHDIYGPDVWEWQQFSGPCNCIPTDRSDQFIEQLIPHVQPQQFLNPFHWLEHHLSTQVAHISPTTSSIWDVVTDVLCRYHCEILSEDLDNFPAVPGRSPSLSSMNLYYYRRALDYSPKRFRLLPTIRIQARPSALRSLEERGIGETGTAGDAFRTEVVLRQASRELGLDLELKDVFSSPRAPTSHTFSWSARKHSHLPFPTSALLKFSNSSALHFSYSILSTVFEMFVSVPMTIATVALTIICFYSRPFALRVGL